MWHWPSSKLCVQALHWMLLRHAQAHVSVRSVANDHSTSHESSAEQEWQVEVAFAVETQVVALAAAAHPTASSSARVDRVDHIF
jgi:hypothetical protein